MPRRVAGLTEQRSRAGGALRPRPGYYPQVLGTSLRNSATRAASAMAAHAAHAAHAALAIAASAALWLAGCADPAPPLPRGVLLISLDTLRTDATSLYREPAPGEPELTPFLAELGRRGTVFEKHVVNSNNTLVSHASILTGLFPEAHGVFDTGLDNRTLSDGIVTLPTRFAAAGWSTAAFTAHPAWLGRSFGLDHGFATIESDWVDAEEISRRFLTWLDREAPERFFCFLHFYDAHSELDAGPDVLPYEAPPEYLERFAPPRPDDFTGSVVNRAGETVRTSRYLEHYASPFRDLPPDHLAFLRGCYDAGVAKLDADLRALFDELAARGIADDLLVVVTSDHGEEFKEHQRLLHMEYYEEIMRVPLVVSPPPDRLEAWRAAGASARVAQLTRSVDLMPTLLELCDLPAGFTQGSSFAPALTSGAPIPWRDSVFATSILRGRDSVSEYKVCDIDGYYTFYDLDADPREQESLVDRGLEWNRVDPERWAAVQARVAAARAANGVVFERFVVQGAGRTERSAEEHEMLQALGYFGESEQQPAEDGSAAGGGG